MISSNLKKVIGFGLGALLVGTVAFGVSSPDFISRLTRAESAYICAGNVRLEPNGDGSYNITHIGNGATTVDLSTLLETYDVVTISADAFDDCRDTLTSVTIDANIPIEDGAFNNMSNVLDVTFTGDMTEINYGHIFENTEIGTMTIPGNVTYVSEETFYGVVDTTNLIYEGSFDNFWGQNGSDGIFGSLWNAFKDTSSSGRTPSMPTNIIVDSTTYHTSQNDLTTTSVTYRNSRNKDSFGYKRNKYYRNI